MSTRNSRRLLLLAIVLSLLIHLGGARLAHWSIPVPVDVPERVTMARVSIRHLPRRTPPPQTPKPPVATPAARTHARKVPVAVPHVNSHRAPGALPVTLAARPTPAPTPRPTPARLPTPAAPGACVDPNAAAAVRAAPPPPDIPTDVRANSKRGIAQIRIALSAAGEVTGAAVESSTGNGALDQIALDFARGATYSPPLLACKAVAGSYLFRVKFITP